ncbi:metalloregulator ArsR/SmtB family transcription factor [Ktedonosporobacter rubrisoli]|uniref:Metalloregulator ArsR/SmtB family transcription factor n=1 Tax=Ktedonosporobacter rubrisoli TaxID=2509675 RepID=A0A4V0YY75_KTERU|nr:metalloregulator ArsR/SmtB family transcription factor [Ktedonosporobacter rubrisoli]QBD75241.1 metalloregulator ArsR/SmtB family transcription factor [Ktedonosporobacter rubrisoli]
MENTSPSEASPEEARRWKPQDVSAMNIQTEQDPRFLTPQLAQLRVFGLALSDPMRVLILGLLAEEERPLYGQEIAEQLGVTAQTISHHLQILKNGGLVREERRKNAFRFYTLDTANIHKIRETFFADDHLGLQTKQETRQRIVEIFFQEGRLLSIPNQHSKRRIILEELIHKFEWGRIYSEAEVNTLLKDVYDDVSSLRRYLVDEHFMLREHGRYWLLRPHDSHE